MDKAEYIAYWTNEAERDYPVMQHLFEAGDYEYALFIGHLIIEKLLKAVFVSNPANPDLPPRSHDLLLLSEKAGMQLSDEYKKLLALITTFNIQARYADYTNNFRAVCTKSYCELRMDEIKEVRAWLLNILQA